MMYAMLFVIRVDSSYESERTVNFRKTAGFLVQAEGTVGVQPIALV